MIKHEIFFLNNGFNYSWDMELTYRINKGDFICDELMSNEGKLRHDKVESDEWIKFCCQHEFFEVDYIVINHIGVIEVWLKLATVE